ncbi:MAG: ankyrin repeat domain-containing protein [Magnetospirillum sp. WYHS-4]
MNAPRRRFYTISPDYVTAAGYENLAGAEAAAVAFGNGAHVVDTLSTTYTPAIYRVEEGELRLQGQGSFDHRHGLGANLIEAARKRIPPLVRALLAKGADPDSADHDGGTALHWAVAGGSFDVVRLLVEAGADPRRTDSDGTTPLALARSKHRDTIAEFLEQISG